MTAARDVVRQECCRHNTYVSYYETFGISRLLREEKEAWVVCLNSLRWQLKEYQIIGLATEYVSGVVPKANNIPAL